MVEISMVVLATATNKTQNKTFYLPCSTTSIGPFSLFSFPNWKCCFIIYGTQNGHSGPQFVKLHTFKRRKYALLRQHMHLAFHAQQYDHNYSMRFKVMVKKIVNIKFYFLNQCLMYTNQHLSRCSTSLYCYYLKLSWWVKIIHYGRELTR